MNHLSNNSDSILYSARGKLMITGEYLALKGSRCLAWPTISTHSLLLTPVSGPADNLIWNAADFDNQPWFDALFDTRNNIEIISASDMEVANKLASILNAAIVLCGKNILKSGSFQVETRIGWPMNWGMGSSSSLLVNIASWFQIDPFRLQQETIGGSGYDIACALSDQPIIFQRGKKLLASRVHRPAILSEHGGLAYLGQKADTASSIVSFEEKIQGKDLSTRIDLINRLTYHILDAPTISHLNKAIAIHEETIGFLLGVDPIKNRLFPTFDGMVKSLGAWGGDFILFSGNKKLNEYKKETEEQYGLKIYSIKELLV
ncbi:MAG: hypothetical protein J5I59_01090 [Saprospiraceae bacterium]|nr:hypothetical protein [Saprospiraceae bacterium]